MRAKAIGAKAGVVAQPGGGGAGGGGAEGEEGAGEEESKEEGTAERVKRLRSATSSPLAPSTLLSSSSSSSSASLLPSLPLLGDNVAVVLQSIETLMSNRQVANEALVSKMVEWQKRDEEDREKLNRLIGTLRREIDKERERNQSNVEEKKHQDTKPNVS
jgi:hypothetical protein